MDLDGIAFDRRFGQPVVKDGCGVFGMLRKAGSPLIPNSAAINGISCIKYRGSDLGAGYAAFRTPEVPGGAPYRIQAFVTTESVANRIRGVLEESIGPVDGSRIRRVDKRRTDLVVWEANVTPRLEDSDDMVEKAVDSGNSSLFRDGFEGRVFSYGR